MVINMNIIRTKAMELTTIPAVAYKQKLPAGGAGIKILRLDQDVTAVATIDKRSGETIPYGKMDETLFPLEAFDEAAELLMGLPYSARGNISVKIVETPATEKADLQLLELTQEQESPKENMVESDEYKAIVERYSDEKGKLNYQLMNKDFIQFASRSKTVSEMIGAGMNSDEILVFIIKSRASYISGNKKSLEDDRVKDLIETLDEIDPRSAFKELNTYLNRQLARRK